jgi:hypothetical protein
MYWLSQIPRIKTSPIISGDVFFAEQKMLNLRVLRFLIVVGAMTVAGACLAQQSSSVWDTFERTLGRNAGLGAHEIAVTYEVPGDSGPQVGSYTTHVGRWDAKGNPDRVLVKGGEKTYAMARLDLSIAEHIANHPEALFEQPYSIHRSGDETIDGQVFAVYEIQSRFVQGTKPVKARLWMARESGAIYKVEGILLEVGLPGVKTADFVLQYAPDAQGRSMPATLELRYTISIFFHTGEVSFKERFADWRSKLPN